MRVIGNKDVDRKKWDELILSSATPLVFAQSFYLDAVCPGWKALISEDGDAVFPLTESKKMGLTYLIQPPFTPQLGCFGESKAEPQLEFIEYIKKKYVYAAIELNAGMDASLFSGKKRTYVIHSHGKGTLNSNTKRNLEAALRSGTEIISLDTEAAFELSESILYPFMKKKLKITEAHLKIFRNLLKNAAEGNALKSFLAVNNGVPDALGHFISNGKHAVYLKGCSDGKVKGSMHLLMSSALEYFKGKRIQLFDFGGGQGSGLAQFYAGFGAEELIYGKFEFSKIPGIGKLRKK